MAPTDTAQTGLTGLTAEQLQQFPTPAEALGALDRQLTAATPCLLVAQHAATEAGIIHHRAEHCPTPDRTDLLETIP